MNWFLAALKKYAVFEGRARRKEYWFFSLFYFLIYLGLVIIDMITGSYDEKIGMGLLTAIFTLAMVIPALAVGVRRLHDTNRNGLWLLIGLIPIIGAIALIIFFVADSQPNENQYGPNPKAAFA